MAAYSWVKDVLNRHFAGVDWQKGVDLDQNGAVTFGETIQDYDLDRSYNGIMEKKQNG